MDWKEFTEYTKTLTDMAAQKLGEVTDLATLHVRCKTAERRLDQLYEDFGRVSYRHFTMDDSLTADITKYVEGITLLRREIAALKKEIRQRRSTDTDVQA